VHLFMSGGLNLDFSLIGHAVVYIEAAVQARLYLRALGLQVPSCPLSRGP
jgi:hypothetical protein